MDVLDEDVIETEKIDSLTFNNLKIRKDIDQDAVESESNKKYKNFDSDNNNVKKMKKSDDDKYNSNIYDYLLKDKTDETSKTNVKHVNGSFKFDLKNEMKKDDDDSDDFVILVRKTYTSS